MSRLPNGYPGNRRSRGYQPAATAFPWPGPTKLPPKGQWYFPKGHARAPGKFAPFNPRRVPGWAGWGWMAYESATDYFQWKDVSYNWGGWTLVANCGTPNSPPYGYGGAGCGLTFYEDNRQGIVTVVLGFAYLSTQQGPRVRGVDGFGSPGWLAPKAQTWRQPVGSSNKAPPAVGLMPNPAIPGQGARRPPAAVPQPVQIPAVNPYMRPGVWYGTAPAIPYPWIPARNIPPLVEGSDWGYHMPEDTRPGGWFRPRPIAPLPAPFQPARPVQPGVVVTPGGAVAVTSPHAPRRPGPNERERKVSPMNNRVARLMYWAMSVSTEVYDFLEILWESLPADVRGNPAYDGRRPDDIIRAAWHNWRRIDTDTLMWGVLYNAVEDRVIGTLAAARQKELQRFVPFRDFMGHIRSASFIDKGRTRVEEFLDLADAVAGDEPEVVRSLHNETR